MWHYRHRGPVPSATHCPAACRAGRAGPRDGRGFANASHRSDQSPSGSIVTLATGTAFPESPTASAVPRPTRTLPSSVVNLKPGTDSFFPYLLILGPWRCGIILSRGLRWLPCGVAPPDPCLSSANRDATLLAVLSSRALRSSPSHSTFSGSSWPCSPRSFTLVHRTARRPPAALGSRLFPVRSSAVTGARRRRSSSFGALVRPSSSRRSQPIETALSC